MQTLLLPAAIVASAFLIAFLALVGFATFEARRKRTRRVVGAEDRSATIFVFDDEILVDATPTAREFLETAPAEGSDWARFSRLLAPDFPDLARRVGELAELGEMEFVSRSEDRHIRAQWEDGLAWFTFDAQQAAVATASGEEVVIAMRQELTSLRDITEHAPFPQWKESPSGEIVWANRAYLDLAALASDRGPEVWPPAPIFDLPTGKADTESDDEVSTERLAISLPDEDTRRWFDIWRATRPDGSRVCTASPVDALVQAETSLREFVTTLTKTFAALPIGLVIFDRARALTMFNPALIDLTGLPASFLVSRPSLASFLDKLRDARMIPEPRDYKSWRQQIADLVRAAEHGDYEETWALPTGQTYRVTGRPHPDGALALLFEDISSEVTLTRRFRTEIEISQTVLDALPSAIAVFTASGVLATANTPYARLWGRDPSTTLAEVSLDEALAGWREACAPTPLWAEIRKFATRTGPRTAWTGSALLKDGRALSCHVAPLAQGATMVAFSLEGAPGLEERHTSETSSSDKTGVLAG
ncbi:MAG: PAS domain-containing protein [Alphaproteobacteria bacterium]|nr:MAG: PAS domain-containing protein [Alphaproteobacteria bacterium]